jgi:hypothetical protein
MFEPFFAPWQDGSVPESGQEPPNDKCLAGDSCIGGQCSDARVSSQPQASLAMP